MRGVRPTVKVLGMLPPDTFADAGEARLVSRRQWDEVELDRLAHPLLEDARTQFASGVPDKHRGLSQSCKRTVYEVRDRTGAGWRGRNRGGRRR
jgi:hypothetical protein